MQRHCDGTDEYLIGANDEPCACGQTFDDVDHSTLWPHGPIHGGMSRDAVRRLLNAHSLGECPIVGGHCGMMHTKEA